MAVNILYKGPAGCAADIGDGHTGRCRAGCGELQVVHHDALAEHSHRLRRLCVERQDTAGRLNGRLDGMFHLIHEPALALFDALRPAFHGHKADHVLKQMGRRTDIQLPFCGIVGSGRSVSHGAHKPGRPGVDTGNDTVDHLLANGRKIRRLDLVFRRGPGVPDELQGRILKRRVLFHTRRDVVHHIRAGVRDLRQPQLRHEGFCGSLGSIGKNLAQLAELRIGSPDQLRHGSGGFGTGIAQLLEQALVKPALRKRDQIFGPLLQGFLIVL